MQLVYVTAIIIKADGFFPWGIAIIVWALLGIMNLIAAHRPRKGPRRPRSEVPRHPVPPLKAPE